MLATKHAGFMDIVIARLIKHCPYIIPRYFDDDPVRFMPFFSYFDDKQDSLTPRSSL
jgi:hypothetical protein